MKHWTKYLLVYAALLLSGCRRSAEGHFASDLIDQGDLIGDLGAEIASLHQLAVIRALIFLIVVVILVTFLNHMVSRAQQIGRRFGLRQRGRVTALGLTARLVILLLACTMVVQQFGQKAPLLTFFGAIIVVIGVCVGIAYNLWNAIAGMILVFESRLKRGDRLQVGAIEGIVQRVGLLRIRLQRADGRQVYVPLSHINRGVIGVSSPSRAVPVELTFHRNEAFSQVVREKLRQRAALCPYRDPSSEAVVFAPDQDETALGVRLYAWSTEAAVMAEAYLRESMELLMADIDSSQNS